MAGKAVTRTPRQFLVGETWTTGGEYTCLRVKDGRIQLWDFHQKRLVVQYSAKEDVLRTQILTAVRAHDEAMTNEWMVTVLHADNGYRVHVYKMPPLQFDATGHVQAITVLVLGAPRTNAHIKHVQWIHDREPLEKHALAKAEELKLPRPFGEVLLHRPPSLPVDSTLLYEGLITNFFAVHRGILYTADSDVLLGSTRQLVIDACHRLGVQLRLEPPRLEDAATWDGAFVTSKDLLVNHHLTAIFLSKVWSS
ncbi:hypothetical protein AeMF1_016078 [Aphanomyces euteiches]|nr:hypothetical protein AeMF1_016078 [Aphanomyces euteiches]KAH9196458.1 hypothetical protein AeNC1_001539 [Aphanomyces euteiches]